MILKKRGALLVMKLFKIAIFTLLFLFGYLSLGLFFYFSYGTEQDSGNVSRVVEAISGKLNSLGFTKLYYFDESLIYNDKSTFFLDFSLKDFQYKDSLYSLITSGKIRILEDRHKEWKKFNIIYNGKKIKAKFKLHGSSITPYILGSENFTIKSKSGINGYTKFKLITGLEFSYFNIFSNYMGKKFDLIAEDIGKIVVTNSRGELSDFHQYQVFDEDYIKTNYDLEKPIIIRRITFDNRLDTWHSSVLDDTPYNIDLENIQKKDFDNWSNFIKNPLPYQYDQEYIGRFLALLQLFGHPHQITGNNDKWILSNEKLYPVFRNEGSTNLLKLRDLSENLFFDIYYPSKSLDVYKKLLQDSLVLLHRNKTFKMFLDQSDEIINDLDSVFLKNKKKHSMYNLNFLKLKYQHKLRRETINNNLKEINNYLTSGYLLISKLGNQLIIKSSKKNLLQFELEDRIIMFTPTNYEYENDKLMTINDELIIKDVSDISSLKIKDLVVNKYLKFETDYNIISIN